jgi:hypothetical protein
MTEEKPKRGRPATDKAMTPAQRQRASRAARKKERFETTPAIQISMMLSAEASQALEQLVYEGKVTRKAVIERLLIEAYRKS